MSNPELAFYEYRSGNRLRKDPDQAALLQRIFKLVFERNKANNQKELQRLFFEFQAGGGKTKIVAVLIMARAIIEGKVPLFFAVPEIFDITKEDLKSALMELFGFKLETLDIHLGKNFANENFSSLKNHLQYVT